MSNGVKPRVTLASLDARVTVLENIATDIHKIKSLLKWVGPSIIAMLMVNGRIDQQGSTVLTNIITALTGA